MKVKKAGGVFLAAILAAGSTLGTVEAANQSYMIPYTANYDSSAYPQKQINAVFTDTEIIVDGIADAAYENAEASRIENVIPVSDYSGPEEEQSYGILKALWDGPVLYLLVEVHDATPHRGTEEDKGGPSKNPAVPANLDSVIFGIDLYNDKVLYETDTIGTFTIGSNGALYYYRNANIPSLGSPMGDPIHPEYQNRIKEYAVTDLADSSGGIVGYTVELAVQLEGLELQNGTQIGVEIEISDVAVEGEISGANVLSTEAAVINENADGPEKESAAGSEDENAADTESSENAADTESSENEADAESSENEADAENSENEADTEGSENEADAESSENADNENIADSMGNESIADDSNNESVMDETDNGSITDDAENADAADGMENEDSADNAEKGSTTGDEANSAAGIDSTAETDDAVNSAVVELSENGSTGAVDGDNIAAVNAGQDVITAAEAGEEDGTVGEKEPDGGAAADSSDAAGAGEAVPMADNQEAVTGTSVRVSNIFWSHGQSSLYEDLNHEHPNAVDWGTLTLSGWNGTDPFAYSNWRLTNAIRYLDSIAFPKGVYTQESQAALDAARAQAEAVIGDAENGNPDKAAADAADQLETAIRNLRWADTRYPDPDELPDQMTLPNPYKFFQSDRIVKSMEDWGERRAEILDMAQFYEYGYKPGKPDEMTIQKIQHYNIGDKRTILFWGFWPMEVTVNCPTDVVTIDIIVGAAKASLDFTVYSPTEEQLQASGHTDGPIPVVLSYDGDNEVYRDAGFAVVEVPSGSGGDVRSNEYAWGTRTGAFYTLYPYSRNGEGALKEVSSEMAAAWSATRVIDALEMMSGCALEGLRKLLPLWIPVSWR